MNKFVCLLLVFVCLFGSFGLVVGEVLVDSYSFGAQYSFYNLMAIHPSGSSYYSAFGQTFIPSFQGANLTTVQLWLKKVGSPTSNLTLTIEGASGIFGSSSVPNGTVFATSLPFVSSGLAVEAQSVNFTFPSGYVFESIEPYALVLYVSTTGITASNYVAVGYDGSLPISHIGNLVAYNNGVFVSSGSDLVFNIYGVGGDVVEMDYNQGVKLYINTAVTNVTVGGSSDGGVVENFFSSNLMGFILEVFMVGLMFFVMMYVSHSRAPLLGLIVGLFTVLVGLYVTLDGAFASSMFEGLFSLLVMVIGAVGMLLSAFGINIRRR